MEGWRIFSCTNMLCMKADAKVSLKQVIDAIETYMQTDIEKRVTDMSNVEEVDFTIQYAEVCGYQWINGLFQHTPYVPKIITINVPPGSKPGQIIQVFDQMCANVYPHL